MNAENDNMYILTKEHLDSICASIYNNIKRDVEFLEKTAYSRGYTDGYNDGFLADSKPFMNKENERKENNEKE